jgi:hypothetical protein
MPNREQIRPNKERIRLWVEALESGNYQQGTGKLVRRALVLTDGDGPFGLTTVNEYCCLGVAIRVAIDNGIDNPEREEAHLGNGTALSQDVRGWYGLDDVDPVIGDGTLYAIGALTAIRANDGLDMSFLKIAKALRDEYDLGDAP